MRIHVAESTYFAGVGRYAGSISQLANYMQPETLVSIQQAGYSFAITSSGNGYAIHADPLSSNTRARRHFYSDETGVIRQTWTNSPAGPGSPQLK
jgi:hypothetical protein